MAHRPRRRMREQAKRLTWLTEAQAALGWGLILILAALLGAIYLGQISRIASIGRRVQVLQNELEAIKRENVILEREIAEAQSLERLQQEAIRLGFVQSGPEDIEYIIVPNYPVDDNDVTASTEGFPSKGDSRTVPTVDTAAAPPETMTEALWLSVKTSIGDLIRGEAVEQ